MNRFECVQFCLIEYEHNDYYYELKLCIFEISWNIFCHMEKCIRKTSLIEYVCFASYYANEVIFESCKLFDVVKLILRVIHSSLDCQLILWNKKVNFSKSFSLLRLYSVHSMNCIILNRRMNFTETEKNIEYFMESESLEKTHFKWKCKIVDVDAHRCAVRFRFDDK